MSPTSPASFYSAGSLDSGGSTQVVNNEANPFRFTTTTLAKNPLSKSVSTTS